jgi:hypothetical protein
MRSFIFSESPDALARFFGAAGLATGVALA